MSKKKGNTVKVNLRNANITGSSLIIAGGDAPSAPPSAENASSPTPPNPATLALFHALRDQFTLEELQALCWELGLRWEDLPSQTLSGKAQGLVQQAEQKNLTAALVALVKRERPDAV